MFHKVDEEFNISEYNPFTKTTYDSSWIIFCLTNSEDYQMMVGNGGAKPVYTMKVSKNYPEWRMSVMDFIGCNEFYGKNMIVSISDDDLKEAADFYGGHHFNEKCLRDYEPAFLIHSTTQENWRSIQSDGCLKSWNILKREKPNWEEAPIGKALGDPHDFSDFIMFSDGGIAGEIVVLSKQKGIITMNQDMPYQTGVRLYFDMEKMAGDGLLIRDGCHLKVKDTLPLHPYLKWVGDWESAGLPHAVSTPKAFTMSANERFNQLYGNNRPKGIILFGAMGVGDTTLGKEIAARLGLPHFDLDDYHWRWDTDIPYTVFRSREERTEHLLSEVAKHPRFVMSGSMWSIRKAFEDMFVLAVFMTAPAEICAERIRQRSIDRWGGRVLPGGDMYEASGVYRDYAACARSYDRDIRPNMCMVQHEEWAAELPCPVLRLDGTKDIGTNAELVLERYQLIQGEKEDAYE